MGNFIHVFLEKEDGILKILALLQKIEQRINLIFPNAYQFIRPGFDE